MKSTQEAAKAGKKCREKHKTKSNVSPHSSHNKESIKFPMPYFQFSLKNFISKTNNNVVNMLYTLIKHAYNKPVRILVRMVQII